MCIIVMQYEQNSAVQQKINGLTEHLKSYANFMLYDRPLFRCFEEALV